jgi:hypothetical protein
VASRWSLHESLSWKSLRLEHASLTDELLFYLAPFSHLRRKLVWPEVAGCPMMEAGWSEIREFKRLQGVKMSPGVAPSLPRDEDGYVCLPALRAFLWPEKAP